MDTGFPVIETLAFWGFGFAAVGWLVFKIAERL